MRRYTCKRGGQKSAWPKTPWLSFCHRAAGKNGLLKAASNTLAGLPHRTSAAGSEGLSSVPAASTRSPLNTGMNWTGGKGGQGEQGWGANRRANRRLSGALARYWRRLVPCAKDAWVSPAAIHVLRGAAGASDAGRAALGAPVLLPPQRKWPGRPPPPLALLLSHSLHVFRVQVELRAPEAGLQRAGAAGRPVGGRASWLLAW